VKEEYDFSRGERGKLFRDKARLRIPDSNEKPNWEDSSGQIGKLIVQETEKSLNAYREQPRLITEHALLELDTTLGGYAHRQLFELVQNSADALLQAVKGRSVLVRLTKRYFYCADDGDPIDKEGLEGLMFDRMSNKRNSAAIGRFGRGFKSVLRVTDAPEFFSRSGSFRFDRTNASKRIRNIAPSQNYPVLRLPEPIDPYLARKEDEDLQELMTWATNIVRLPLGIEGAYEELAQQIETFPPEFLLFVDHVRYLTLEGEDYSRSLTLQHRDDGIVLDTGEKTSSWRVFRVTHNLSAEALADWHLHDDNKLASIQWAVPLDQHLSEPGRFWAFFPTDTSSLVAGILNAPWKTNEDRHSLLKGHYNDELIKAAAQLIARKLPEISATEDPARHLDALPRRREGGDSEQANLLRESLFKNLRGQAVVPDQDGNLRAIGDISYPPEELTEIPYLTPLERWASYPDRPRDWLHHRAITHNRVKRLGAIKRLQRPDATNRLDLPSLYMDTLQGVSRTTIAKWLEALVTDKEGDEAIHSSKAAILTAASIPSKIRTNEELGHIVLTANGDYVPPDPDCIFLPEDNLDNGHFAETAPCVHPELFADPDTLSALRILGIKPPSSESGFRLIAKRILESGNELLSDRHYSEFWISSRTLSVETALTIIQEFKDRNQREPWRSRLHVLTRAGNWLPLHSVLFPGDVVPGDGGRDDDATIDMGFHEPDEKIMRDLGVTDEPEDGLELSTEPLFYDFQNLCREQFTSRPLERKPHSHLLDFETSAGCGPLHVLTRLSEEGRVVYTDLLLHLDATFSRWTMHHETQRHAYPDLPCESFPIHILRQEGRIRTKRGKIVSIADAAGPAPKNPGALQTLLSHPKADKIKKAFDLAEPIPEFTGEGDPVPLADVWPGLEPHLPIYRKQCRIVPCERIGFADQSLECVFYSPNVYIRGGVEDNQRHKIQLVLDELELPLSREQIESILQRKTPADIHECHEKIRQLTTDSERLLEAIGEDSLRQDLPSSLLSVLEQSNGGLTGTEIAEAAIATYHTDTLKQYRWALQHLAPPSQWAGSSQAISFVHSLGFSTEWAGDRTHRLEPFLEVEGPLELGELHGYQKVVVRNLRKMLRYGDSDNTPRRGMVSMPTGSGKTRVAVQGIIEAIRDDGFVGGVIWVADRSELCEQAVEAWRQVWSSIGIHESHLRISRMWGGQPKPLPTNEMHVVVATIQTLNARLSNPQEEYEFLRDFKLVVFDEAHRSIAPTFTSVMEEIGLTRRQKSDEPFLVGLTATPYRGYNEEETRWLANRYGSNRLDAGAFESDEAQDVIHELQSNGVLAQADHGTIKGETLSIDDFLENSSDFNEKERQQELEKLRSLPWLPQNMEDRIAQSVERTRRIIEAYETHVDPDWSTLIFATSVEHTKTVAALLNRKGIRSRAVSGNTEMPTRRRVVEEFRSGKIKALVNYGVFREGFDAPKTRAIIVARPVYSPNLYFQMIGRGLRGPRNGGDGRCLILNVQDNIENFDRSLAFSELDWLWA